MLLKMVPLPSATACSGAPPRGIVVKTFSVAGSITVASFDAPLNTKMCFDAGSYRSESASSPALVARNLECLQIEHNHLARLTVGDEPAAQLVESDNPVVALQARYGAQHLAAIRFEHLNLGTVRQIDAARRW